MLNELIDFDHIFGTSQIQKQRNLTDNLWTLTEHHLNSCSEYRKILKAIASPSQGLIEDVPWLPVRLFKEHELRSIDSEQVFRRLTSSGTTGASVSKIDIDSYDAQRQSKALSRTLQEILGPQRLPMLIVDSKMSSNSKSFSARGAGVLGMMSFGRNHVFALNSDETLDEESVTKFVKDFGDQRFLIFGFTFMIWKFLSSLEIDLGNGVLVHSGGWKKLESESVSQDVFRKTLLNNCRLKRIFNYYGMVEQMGTVFLESAAGDGTLTCPNFADVIIRDPLTFEVQPDGVEGLIQVLSLLPTSYPGHSILTEDLGLVVGVDDQTRRGKRFVVNGRLPRAEARGCSDTFVGSS